MRVDSGVEGVVGYLGYILVYVGFSANPCAIDDASCDDEEIH